MIWKLFKNINFYFLLGMLIFWKGFVVCWFGENGYIGCIVKGKFIWMDNRVVLGLCYEK